MRTRDIALVSILTAATVAVAFAKGLSIPSLPGLVEFMTVLIFISGFCFGPFIGASIGILSETIYQLVPFPFAHPAGWLFVISPILLGIMALLGAMYGVAGGILGKRRQGKTGRRILIEMGLSGFILTLIFDIMSSVGFYLAYPVFDFWTTLLWTFVPAYYPYPPIVHTVTNTLVFLVIAPPLINRIEALQLSTPGVGQNKQEKA